MGINYSKFHEQTVDSYRYVDYGGNSIYNSGCGPASLANALMVLGIADMTVKDACEFAVFCGARIRDAGTNMSTLLKHAAEKWPITYRTTSSNAELAAHLRAGGVAIMNQGDTYKVFSNGGHFVVAAAIDSADNVTVIDSYWNTKKYKTWPEYHAKSEILYRCFVRTPLYWCGKATIDRSPSYYLISREIVTDTKNTEKDVEDMTESDVKKIIAAEAAAQAKKAVSSWATDAWNAAVSAGVLDGTAPQGNLTREQFAVVLRRLGLVGGSDTPSSWAANAWTAATDAGVLDGTNPHGIVNREMLAQVAFALGLLDVVQVDGGTMESHKSTE